MGERRVFLEQFQKELESYGIAIPTFQWDQTETTPWDQLCAKIIIKHWLHAKEQGAISGYPLDDQFSNHDTLDGVLEGCLCGQKHTFKKPKSRKRKVKSRVQRKVSLHHLIAKFKPLAHYCFFLAVALSKPLVGENLAQLLLPGL